MDQNLLNQCVEALCVNNCTISKDRLSDVIQALAASPDGDMVFHKLVAHVREEIVLWHREEISRLDASKLVGNVRVTPDVYNEVVRLLKDGGGRLIPSCKYVKGMMPKLALSDAKVLVETIRTTEGLTPPAH